LPAGLGYYIFTSSTLGSMTESTFPFFFLGYSAGGDLSPFLTVFSSFLALGSGWGSAFFFFSGLKSGYSLTYYSSFVLNC
jgi:hypothetical protein